MQNKETVLWYCPDPLLAGAAEKVFFTQGVRTISVSPAKAGQTVGRLFGLEGYPEQAGSAPGPAPSRPVLVLSGFSRPRLDALLAALREAGLPRIDCKAVLTPTNVSWSFRALYKELAAEHAAMHGGE